MHGYDIQLFRGVITNSGKDDMARPVQQVQSLGTTGEMEVFFPYGVHANLPVNAMALVMKLAGQSSSKVAMGSMPNKRQTLQAGEVMFYHPLTGAEFRFHKDGSVTLRPSAESKNGMTMTKSGSFEVEGDLKVSGKIQGGTVVTDAGTDLDGHDHDFDYQGAGDGSTPQSGTTESAG